VAKQYLQENDSAIRVLHLHENRGKGAALKIGVRECLGHIVLIVS
jgi:glycosyltransferase involved in cell wall biosynthesis